MSTFTEFICNNLQAITNSGGLLLDIAGAWFVAWEVINQFKGTRTESKTGVAVNVGGLSVVPGQKAGDTDEYKKWELRKYWKMKIGLGLLTVGFLLQIVSNWVTKFV